MNKGTKRITLFPLIDKDLSNEAIIGYFDPMMKLGLLPSVSPAIKLKVIGAEKRVEQKEVMTVDFIATSPNHITVSVTSERIDIILKGEEEWSKFKETIDKLIEIIFENNPEGFSRVAVGSRTHRSINEEDLPRLGIPREEFSDKSVREYSRRVARVEPLTSAEGEKECEMNNVKSIRVSHAESGLVCTTEYDINSIPGEPIENVTGLIPLFISKAISIIEE